MSPQLKGAAAAAAYFCGVGAHEWRATVGGPFGYTQPDEDGYVQVCAHCGVKRPATQWETSAARAVRDLLGQLRDVSEELAKARGG
jgi:hypothetical protein